MTNKILKIDGIRYNLSNLISYKSDTFLNKFKLVLLFPSETIIRIPFDSEEKVHAVIALIDSELGVAIDIS